MKGEHLALLEPKTRSRSGNLQLPALSRRTKDRAARRLMGTLAVSTSLLVVVILVALTLRARPILGAHSLRELLTSHTWQPLKGLFGFYPFIIGTFWVTAAGMVLSVPPSLLTAIYLSEYAHPKTRALVTPFIDLLAGIPSVVYGVWGILTVVPFIEKTVAPILQDSWIGVLPIFQSENPTGYGVLAGGVVLAVMVFPVMIAVAQEVISAVPHGLRDAALALGATRWQTVRHVVLKRARVGVLAAIVLGFSRAFGETMAVLMVVGNVPQVPKSIFDAAYPLTALIANNYGEMMSIPLYDAALMGAALILLLIILVFNIGSRLVLARITRGES
jgi:phosphate transport system permease protein